MTTTTQTGHKLSEGFDPAHYAIEAYLDNKRPEYVGEPVEAYKALVAWWEQEQAAVLGPDWRAKNHRCVHCGNGSVRWITAARCIPTGEVVVFGNDCTERLNFSGRDTLKIALLQKRAARRAESLKQHLARVAYLDAHPEVAALVAQGKLDVHATNTFAQDVLAKLERWGSLSDKQVAAVQASFARDIERKAAREAEEAAGTASQFVGVEGTKLAPLAVTCTRVGSYTRPSFSGRYDETVNVCTFVDASGNVLVTKTPTFSVEVGATGLLSGTVKAHSTYRDVRQTQVIRPKLVAPPTEGLGGR